MATVQFPSASPSAVRALLPPATIAAPRAAETAPRWNLLSDFLNVAERCADLVAITTAICCADGSCRLFDLGAPCSPSAVLLSAAAFALLFIVLLERHGGYRAYVSLLAVRDTERILRVTVESLLLALLVAYFATAHIPRLVFLIAGVTVPIFVSFSKLEMHELICLLRSKGYGTRKAVIVGSGPMGKRIYSALLRSPKCGIEPVAFVDGDPDRQGVEIYESSYRRKRAAKVLAGPVCPELLRELDANVLVIATACADRAALLRLASAAGVDTYCVGEDISEPGFWIDSANFDGTMLEHFSKGQARVAGDLAKRAIDLVASAVLLAFFSVPFALIAALVKKCSPGPVFFRQDRVGKDGRLFSIYKFRTMYRDAPQYSYSPGAGDDPRVTPLGRFLRRTSLDELPQLVNVLLGDMSLVGPRPEMLFIVGQYSPLERRRLAVKPGITGLWQLSADRAFPIHQNLEYDLYYVRHRSLFMDVAILLHTLLFAGRGI